MVLLARSSMSLTSCSNRPTAFKFVAASVAEELASNAKVFVAF